MDKKGFIDSKEEIRKEKDQIQEEIQNFDSERLNSLNGKSSAPATRFVKRNGISSLSQKTQKLESFESEKLKYWTANQTLPPHVS